MSRRDFFEGVRTAHNLLIHANVSAHNGHGDPAALTRTAIWLTPSAMKGFNEAEFGELSPDTRRELADAVREFERVAREVPLEGAPTSEQIAEATAALEKIRAILKTSLSVGKEATRVESALAKVDYPPWVSSWDYQIGATEYDDPAVWVTVFFEEQAVPPDQLGRRAMELVPKFRSALEDAEVDRWPYIRVRSVREYPEHTGTRMAAPRRPAGLGDSAGRGSGPSSGDSSSYSWGWRCCSCRRCGRCTASTRCWASETRSRFATWHFDRLLRAISPVHRRLDNARSPDRAPAALRGSELRAQAHARCLQEIYGLAR